MIKVKIIIGLLIAVNVLCLYNLKAKKEELYYMKNDINILNESINSSSLERDKLIQGIENEFNLNNSYINNEIFSKFFHSNIELKKTLVIYLDNISCGVCIEDNINMLDLYKRKNPNFRIICFTTQDIKDQLYSHGIINDLNIQCNIINNEFLEGQIIKGNYIFYVNEDGCCRYFYSIKDNLSYLTKRYLNFLDAELILKR